MGIDDHIQRVGDDLANWQDPRDKDGNGINDEDENIEPVEKDIAEVAIPDDKPSEERFRFLQKTVKGENKAGRVTGKGLDVAENFVPVIGKIRSIGTNILNLKKGDSMSNEREQPLEWLKNRLKEKSTWVGIVIAAAGVFGMELGNEAADVIATGIVGLISAVLVVYKELTDEA